MPMPAQRMQETHLRIFSGLLLSRMAASIYRALRRYVLSTSYPSQYRRVLEQSMANIIAATTTAVPLSCSLSQENRGSPVLETRPIAEPKATVYAPASDAHIETKKKSVNKVRKIHETFYRIQPHCARPASPLTLRHCTRPTCKAAIYSRRLWIALIRPISPTCARGVRFLHRFSTLSLLRGQGFPNV